MHCWVLAGALGVHRGNRRVSLSGMNIKRGALRITAADNLEFCVAGSSYVQRGCSEQGVNRMVAMGVVHRCY